MGWNEGADDFFVVETKWPLTFFFGWSAGAAHFDWLKQWGPWPLFNWNEEHRWPLFAWSEGDPWPFLGWNELAVELFGVEAKGPLTFSLVEAKGPFTFFFGWSERAVDLLLSWTEGAVQFLIGWSPLASKSGSPEASSCLGGNREAKSILYCRSTILRHLTVKDNNGWIPNHKASQKLATALLDIKFNFLPSICDSMPSAFPPKLASAIWGSHLSSKRIGWWHARIAARRPSER